MTQVRSITALMELNEKRCGTIEEATEMMHRLMAACRKTGKKGTLTLKFEVAPDKNDELALTINCTPTVSIPSPERRKALIYHDAEGHAFSKIDPRQLEMLAEQEEERAERERALQEANVARIGRGVEAVAG
jgi:hypothetical protein